ncbi:MAG: helix-turn-helix transcriptional regulator [Chloroflexi bacterium]|nr:helix-turn-helix transcriptional regulator [Chloroflexota bacterium]
MRPGTIDRQRFVQKLMELQGYETQLTLARRLRVHPSTITRIYSGQRSPGLRLVTAVLRAFPQVRPEDLGLIPQSRARR